MIYCSLKRIFKGKCKSKVFIKFNSSHPEIKNVLKINYKKN